ncbi:MAG: DUF4147 domain-containing protein, partial [Myxococcota bacterium]
MSRARGALEALFHAALDAVAPRVAVARGVKQEGERLTVARVALPPETRCVVLAVGKAAPAMAAAFAAEAGGRVRHGLVVTKEGHGPAPGGFRGLEAGHPLPDARSEAAGAAVLATAATIDPADVLVVLLSGGASALLAFPAVGLTLAELRETTDQLLRAG